MKILIIGAGEVGVHIARRLSAENKEVTVVDQDQTAVRRVSESLDVRSVHGSGCRPGILTAAGICSAEILLAVTDSDEVNIMTCLLANFIAPGVKKLARIRNAELAPFHSRLREEHPQIDTIINPETEVVKTIRRLMSIPGAVDAGEFVEGRVSYGAVRMRRASKFVGMKLSAFSARYGEDHPLIAALVRGSRVIVPDGESRFMPNDLVYFISDTATLEKKLSLFGLSIRPVRTALIIGGGRIGERLARTLSGQGIKTKLIESDLARCHALSETTGSTVVLHGDGSDQTLLMEENISDIDVVIPVTDDDETNILISLLAKSLGAGDTITKIGKTGYQPLLPAIGIDRVVSPRLSAISSILQDVRQGQILSDISVFGEKGEFIEAVALDQSGITDRPLKQISFPKGAILVCAVRDGRVIIPNGDTVVRPRDRIILFAVHQAVKKLETLLTVKLETV